MSGNWRVWQVCALCPRRYVLPHLRGSKLEYFMIKLIKIIICAENQLWFSLNHVWCHEALVPYKTTVWNSCAKEPRWFVRQPMRTPLDYMASSTSVVLEPDTQHHLQGASEQCGHKYAATFTSKKCFYFFIYILFYFLTKKRSHNFSKRHQGLLIFLFHIIPKLHLKKS